MRFLRQSMIGLFLASLTLGLLAFAAYTVISAVQERLSTERPAPALRERDLVLGVLETQPLGDS